MNEINKKVLDFYKIMPFNIYRVKTELSEAVLFHPLTLHRSVSEGNTINMKPRYSIDIRFFEKKGNLKYKTNTLFKIKKFIKSL
jgi:hypothetical protein